MRKWHAYLPGLCASTSLAQLQIPFRDNSLTNPASECLKLSILLPHLVSFPGSTGYNHLAAQYWSLTQASQQPVCRITPRTAGDISVILSTLYSSDSATLFSLKSGGHSVNVNASNTDVGIAIDLFRLSWISVSKDGKTVDVAAGARWKEVYNVLDGMGLAVNGARAGNVGVGGYLLGGGLSVFSGLHGWACDGVEGYEIVLANGTIVDASTANHPDLFLALKGGGNNFGIVTKFKLKAFPAAPLSTALISYEVGEVAAVVAAQDSFSQHAHLESESSASISVAFDLQGKKVFAIASLVSVGKKLKSSRLGSFFAIPYTQANNETMTPSGLAFLLDKNNPKGFRQHRATLTTVSSAPLAAFITTLFATTFTQHPLFTTDPAFRPALLFQSLTVPQLQHGKNSLGLEDETRPLLLVSLEIRSSFAESDVLARNLMRTFIAACEAEAFKRSLSHDFKYLNYADADQEIGVFSNGQRKRLKAVMKRYDPEEWLRTRLTGPFKL